MDQSGEVVQIVQTYRDITARKQAVNGCSPCRYWVAEPMLVRQTLSALS